VVKHRHTLRETQDLRGPQRRVSSTFSGGEFIVVGGPHSGMRVSITDHVTTIGRSEDNTIALTLDRGVSRRHAVVEWAEGHLHIRDWSSTNGTHLNGKLVQGRAVLSHLDVVTVGKTSLQLIYAEPTAPHVYELRDTDETPENDTG
jgi:pSer/pThr/pTyr-binding forkhead associated (FHA) protein